MDEIILAVGEAVQKAVEPLEIRLLDLQRQQHALGNALLSLGADSSTSKGFTRPTMKPAKPTIKRQESGPKIVGIESDPMMTGDMVYFYCKDMDTPGILTGDQSSKRFGLQAQESRENLNFDDYVFRVYPMLNYRHRNEAESQAEAKARAKKAAKDRPNMSRGSSSMMLQSQHSMGSGEDVDSREALIYQRVEAEVHANNTWMKQLDKGQSKEVVKYGSLYQLLHLKSGLFLSIRDDAAPLDPDCRALSLAEGTSASYFKVVPRFKAQTEGSVVYFGHSLVLESAKFPGTFVHTSSAFYNETPGKYYSSLPKCLQTGTTYEVNAAPQGTTFVVHKHGRFNEEQSQKRLTGQSFRLYHSQSESFMHASCDLQKDTRGEGREQGLPIHIPYLKSLADRAGDRDPANPSNQLCKGVWCFEHVATRMITTVVSWDTPVRLRHTPSGRYLAVDTSRPIRTLNSNGFAGDDNNEWYSPYLVDDSLSPSTADFSDVSTLAMPEQMVFRVLSADKTSAEYVPNVDVSIRLEHTFVDDNGAKRTLYLANSECRKPGKVGRNMTKSKVTSMSIGSFQMVFSTHRSAQDIFKAMPVTEHEQSTINLVKSLLIPCSLYTCNISNPAIEVREDMRPVVSLMLSIMDLCCQGASHHEEKDWVATANSTMPAAFSKMFDGEPDSFAQKICRDMKLMDAVFAMGTAAYDRAYPKNPWTKEPIAEMDGPKAIQKFIHVCLQSMVAMNPENQKYFGKRTSTAHGATIRKLDSALSRTLVRQKLWMDTILEQLEDALGPAVTLSKLLSANEELLRKYATPKLVLCFADMIRKLGPQPRLVNFFEAICTVQGCAVKANQDMVLRLTWMRKEMRQRVYLEVVEVRHKDVKGELKKYPPVCLPSGEMSDVVVDVALYPDEYIAKDTFEQPGGLNPVFLNWLSTESWTKDIDELWWSAKSMGIPTTQILRPATESEEERVEEMVRLEELCWVLNPHALCEAVKGISWGEFCDEKKMDPQKNEKWHSHTQLAGYFVGQLTVHCAMCTGRSSSAIAWLEQYFSYTLLASICYNPHLPHQVRAAATDFIRVLYLDRYPQMQKCGRPSLPETLWVYDLGPNSGHLDVKLDAVPLVRPMVLGDTNALPAFTIPRAHQLHSDKDPIYGFRTHYKFFVLRHFSNEYMRSFGSGTLVHAHREENKLAGAICKVVVDLLSFGFQSSLPKLRELTPVLARLLDGRSDCKFFDEFKGEFEPFEPAKQRFEMTSVSPLVTSLKVTVIKCLADIADLRANFRLANFLFHFKQYNEDPRLCTELKRFHRYFEANKESRYTGPLTDRLFEDFEALFTQGDGKSLMLEDLSGGMDINGILLDCLMYEDDALFANALSLLERQFMQRRKMLRVFSECILLPFPEVPVFGTVDIMITELSYLHSLLRAYPVWGICSRVSGTFGPDKYDKVLLSLGRLNDLFFSVPAGSLETCKTSELPAHGRPSGWKVLRGRSLKAIGSMAHGLSPKRGRGKQSHETKDSLEEDMQTEVSTFQHFVRRRRERHNKSGLPVHKIYQDVARSLNVQSLFEEGLAIDYNLVFKGTICSPEQKVTSRQMLVTVQRKVFAALLQFVRGNKTNQLIVFETCLGALRSHLGPLKHPSGDSGSLPSSDLDGSFPTDPGMGAEEVIIECLRGNNHICEEMVPRDIFELFAELLNMHAVPRGSSFDGIMGIGGNDDSPDLSTSVLVEFFEIACQPTGPAGPVINRNQLYTLDVLLSEELPALRQTVESVFGIGDLCAAPANVARVLCACLREGNMHAASTLQHARLTMDATLSVIEARMKPLLLKHEWAGPPPPTPPSPASLHADIVRPILKKMSSGFHKHKERDAACAAGILEDEYLVQMVLLFSYQMEILVVDPRLYRREGAWVLVSFVARTLLARFNEEHSARGWGQEKDNTEKSLPLEQQAWEEVREEISVATALLRITKRLVDGARYLGLKEFESKYGHFIHEADASLLNVAVAIRSSEVAERVDMGLAQEATELIQVLDSTRLVHDEHGNPQSFSSTTAGSFVQPFSMSPKAPPSPMSAMGKTLSSLEIESDQGFLDPNTSPSAGTSRRSFFHGDGAKNNGTHSSFDLGFGSMDWSGDRSMHRGLGDRSPKKGDAGADEGTGGAAAGGGAEAEGAQFPHPTRALSAVLEAGAGPEDLVPDAAGDQEEQLEEEAIEMAGVEASQDPHTMLQYMTEAASSNPKIKRELLRQRFQLADVLEDIENHTDPNRRQQEHLFSSESERRQQEQAAAGGAGEVAGAGGGGGKGGSPQHSLRHGDSVEGGDDVLPLYGVKVTFSELVDRMVRYAKAHNFDGDESHCIRVFGVLRSCVLKARLQSGHSATSGEAGEAGSAISSSGSDNSVGDKGHGGDNCGGDNCGGGGVANDENEASTSKSESVDRRAQLRKYKEKQNFMDARGVTCAALLAISTHSAGLEDNVADHALDLLMELLHGGSPRVQQSVYRYICEEDKDAKFLTHLKTRMALSQDVIKERKQRVGGGFESMTELQRGGYENAQQTFELVQQMCEGHNLRLQNILREQPMHQSEINVLHEVLKMFALQTDTLEQLQRMEEAEVELLCVSMDVVIELLQGPCPGNQACVTKHEAFLHGIDKVLRGEIHVRVNKGLRLRVKVKAMVLLAAMLEGRLDKMVHRKMVNMFEPKVFELVHGYFSRTLLATSRSTSTLSNVRKEDIMAGVVCLQRVVSELNGMPGYDALTALVLMEQRKKNKGVAAIDEVAVIEIFWNGRVEALSFPLPSERDYLSMATKESFMDSCDLSTAEKRTKQLLHSSPLFVVEMCETYEFAERSFVYKMLYHNITSIKWCMYALVVLLNLNVMMASYGKKHKDKGYQSAWSGLTDYELNPKWRWSLFITWFIGIVNASGYLVIVGYLGINEVPIVIREVDQWVEECTQSNRATVRRFYEPHAFNWAGVSLAAVTMFIIMHVVNYPGEPNVPLYFFLLVFVNLPWTLSCARRFVVVPTTPLARVFVIIYDIILKKGFFRNHVLLMGASVAGFINSPFFSLMLLDIANNSSVLQDIILSISRPFKQLSIVFFTFVITVVIYAQFGVQWFEDWFHYDSLSDEEEPHGCHSVVGCFWLIFYQGIPMAGMAEVVDNVSNRDYQFLARVAFDLSFFVWVGILLFNIITGLIVDTFSELRQQAYERADSLTNSCFVCGITRSAYEDIGLPSHGSPSFDTHRDEVHNVWNYVYFYLYLQRKDPTEYNGVESHVASMLKEHNLNWLPVRTSLAIQNAGLAVNEAGEGGGAHQRSAELKAAFSHEMGGLIREVSAVAQRMEQLEATVADSLE